VFASLRAWIKSLRPYPSLALFAVPLIILEPVKPVAAYLAATGHVRLALMVLILGEILKLVLVERLFSINRDKLLSIPAFAWAYGKYQLAKDWLESTEAWQMVRRWSRIARFSIRSRLAQFRASGLPMTR
jgi:thiol:disulfide interchange protein